MTSEFPVRVHRQQEDFYAYSGLSLDPAELALTYKKAHNLDWDPSALPPAIARQVLFVGIYDGHGGSTVSQFLRQELHGLFENVNKSQIPEVFAWAQELGGYFRRFKGGVLAPWVNPDAPDFQKDLDLETRATLAFFEASVPSYSSRDRRLTFDRDRLTRSCQRRRKRRSAALPHLLFFSSLSTTLASSRRTKSRSLSHM